MGMVDMRAYGVVVTRPSWLMTYSLAEIVVDDRAKEASGNKQRQAIHVNVIVLGLFI